MEAVNCLSKSCEKQNHHQNGPSGSDLKLNNITNEAARNHCDDLNNEEPIEELSSQLKDVLTRSDEGGGKILGSPNGYWMGINCFENGIDSCVGNVYSESDRVRVATKVVTDFHVKSNDVVSRDEEETFTTTNSTASPGSKPDLEIESCASDTNGGDVEQQKHILVLTNNFQIEDNNKIVNASGPFECTYVTCNDNTLTPLTVQGVPQSSATNVRQLEPRSSALPSVTNAGLYSVMPPISHQSCSQLQTSVGCDVDQLQMKFSYPCCEDTNSDRNNDGDEIKYEVYTSELQMGVIMRLIQKDLSEPYSIYTYRYFIHNWPKLCFLAMHGTDCVGAIVCKLDLHKKVIRRGYIAMLAVDERYRKRKIGSNLVLQAIQAMMADEADEVVLETEISNKPALRLYENLGFVRDKRLFRYYLNGVDALRLKLWIH